MPDEVSRGVSVGYSESAFHDRPLLAVKTRSMFPDAGDQLRRISNDRKAARCSRAGMSGERRIRPISAC